MPQGKEWNRRLHPRRSLCFPFREQIGHLSRNAEARAPLDVSITIIPPATSWSKASDLIDLQLAAYLGIDKNVIYSTAGKVAAGAVGLAQRVPKPVDRYPRRDHYRYGRTTPRGLTWLVFYAP
jgi:hypothetical protein